MNKNRGMFLEDLINRSCDYLWNKKIGFITKRFTKVHISQVDGNRVSGFFGSKNFVDYSGQINGQHIEFEAKTTKKNKLYFKNIKMSQLDFLISMGQMKSLAFFIIYFYADNLIVKLDASIIKKMIDNNIKAITMEDAIKKGKELKVLYPGIIKFWK